MKAVKQDGQFETVLNEIPHATSLPHHKKHQQQHHSLYNRCGNVLGGHGHGSNPSIISDDKRSCQDHVYASPISGVSLCSDGSLPRLPLVEDLIAGSKAHHPNGFLIPNELPFMNEVHGSLADKLGLSEKLCGMSIRDEEECSLKFDERSLCGDYINAHGILFDNRSSVGFNHGNVAVKSALEGCRDDFSGDYGRLGCLGPQNLVVDEERRLSKLGLLQHYPMVNLAGPHSSLHRLNAASPHLVNFMDTMNLEWNGSMEHSTNNTLGNLHLHAEAASGSHQGIQVPNTSYALNRASIADDFFCPQQSGSCSIGDRYELKSPSSSHMTAPTLSSGISNVPHCSLPMFSNRVGGTPNGWAPHSPPLTRGARCIEAFSCEDSLIMQGEDLKFVTNAGYNLSTEQKRNSYNDQGRGHLSKKDFILAEIECGKRIYSSSLLPLRYNSLNEIQGYIYLIAKDQRGCRLLQRQLGEGTHEDVQMIFNEIIDRVVELTMDAYGNYLVQKMLEVCTDEQRNHILLVIAGEPGQLIKISLNTHGTRVVQKLIETLKTREHISLAVTALEPGFIDLIKDLNGNHVIQRCLECFSNEDNKFIFYAAAKYCVDIATHRYGCCVLQRCITHSFGEHRENLVREVSANGLLLAQDAFGNYVIQYILELKMPKAITNLISQFEGNYVLLSMQKFSSNVVEKCLHVFPAEGRSRIIHELLATSRFDRLLQDPFANYVIQAALKVSKGPLHAWLVEAIRPFAAAMRTNPYCKRVLSRALLKK